MWRNVLEAMSIFNFNRQIDCDGADLYKIEKKKHMVYLVYYPNLCSWSSECQTISRQLIIEIPGQMSSAKANIPKWDIWIIA